ncbi:MAG: N-acetyl-alpha-D-glucosaminyl L-malate synthase BshA [Planctomycetes bacterium]|nr:N-acetyl-alpha-D-glucosaminyl L-malate synthase BshA [Planctomycetota bacterium]MCB9870265.1 N-acetyl-alpha-D-glucosaminyl L-malate synthase BshA [Planctomycetota bacterium]
MAAPTAPRPEPSSLKLGIVCYPTIGGSGVVATEMAMYAAAQGHEVHLLSYDRPARLAARDNAVRYHNVQVSAYPLFRYPPYDLALATRMLEVQENHGIDVFHVHYAIPHAVSAFLARSMSNGQLRCVTTLHGTDITVVGADPAYGRPTRFAIAQSDAVTAVSEFLACETKKIFGVDTPIEVIPNFVDTARYAPGRAGRYYERDSDERIVVHVSNFRPVKRVADVVRAFAIFQRHVPARLILVGDGPDREHVMAIAADTGVQDRVQHLGPSEATERVLADADLFLLASETESFGLSMLEAMSCGVPCVSTAVGGVQEVLGGVAGSATPFGDLDAMAEAALDLLTDEALHRRVSAAARARAVECFAQDRVAERYFELYRRILAGG